MNKRRKSPTEEILEAIANNFLKLMRDNKLKTQKVQKTANKITPKICKCEYHVQTTANQKIGRHLERSQNFVWEDGDIFTILE